MNNPFSLRNKTILITGASSGIGRTVAIECSKIGATLIITGRNEQRLNQTLKLLAGENHIAVNTDFNNNEQIKILVNKITLLNGIVNCAGISEVKPFQFLKKETLNKTFDTNFFAPIELTRLVLKAKKLPPQSSIVFISSISGTHITNIGYGAYTASKSALSAIAKTMALEYAQKQIRINTIAPGAINTEMLANSGLSPEQIEQDITNYPLMRYGKPEEIAYAAIYLLSEASGWTTGTDMLIDGGYTLK